ncbi:hypothetical protein POM88_018695 [Heracleum sosnowskyi]|uniref:MSP domain-containing protein n=1 Tax=Heracleum sosnowskyi TaxID=360622 RepID=A0AAD8IR08_9APIA|nr:hypothetical protein POM88_018695 [Heracleum sosnowskyi]
MLKKVLDIIKSEKQSSCSINLINVCDDLLAFKIQATSPEIYCVQPADIGLICPNSACEITVTVEASSLPRMCKGEKLLIQSKIVPSWTNLDDVTPAMFMKDGTSHIEDNNVRISLSSRADSPALDFLDRTTNPVNTRPDTELSQEVFNSSQYQLNWQFSDPKFLIIIPRKYIGIKYQRVEILSALENSLENSVKHVQPTGKVQPNYTKAPFRRAVSNAKVKMK